MLQPDSLLKSLQDDNKFTDIMAVMEEMKMMPVGDIWEEYLRRENVKSDYLSEVKKYEREVLVNR